jgi:hypothetical protein
MTDCSSLKTMQQRQKWIYDPHDGTIRSVVDGRCLTIEKYGLGKAINVVSKPCKVGKLKTSYQGKNQQWKVDTKKQTIVSRLNRKW